MCVSLGHLKIPQNIPWFIIMFLITWPGQDCPNRAWKPWRTIWPKGCRPLAGHDRLPQWWLHASWSTDHFEKLKATATSHAVFPMIINDPMGVSLEDLEAYQHGGCKGQELVPTHNAVGSTRGSWTPWPSRNEQQAHCEYGQTLGHFPSTNPVGIVGDYITFIFSYISIISPGYLVQYLIILVVNAVNATVSGQTFGCQNAGQVSPPLWQFAFSPGVSATMPLFLGHGRGQARLNPFDLSKDLIADDVLRLSLTLTFCYLHIYCKHCNAPKFNPIILWLYTRVYHWVFSSLLVEYEFVWK